MSKNLDYIIDDILLFLLIFGVMSVTASSILQDSDFFVIGVASMLISVLTSVFLSAID